MPHDQPQAISVHVEPLNAEPLKWAWAIYREPDRMLIARSLPEYADRGFALKAASTAAKEIGRRLRLPITKRPPGAAGSDIA